MQATKLLRICSGLGEKMAVWQVTISLVKKEGVFSYSMSELWNSISELIEYFPEEKSWCDSIRQFGKLDSTCIEIDTECEEITLRIDLRSITQGQLDAIIGFSNSNELKISYEEQIYEPTLGNFVQIIKASNAFRFLNNPKGFLRSIRNKQ